MRPTLLILIPGFAKDENDTTCIPFSQSLIKAINRNEPGLEVIVITLDFPFTTNEYSWFGNQVIPLNGTQQLRPLLWLKLYRLLKRLSKQKKLSGILNIWCADNALVSQYFSKRNNIPFYTWLQGQDARTGNKALSFFKPSAGSLIALSDLLKKEFDRNYQIKPSQVIYPGVDESMFQTVDTKKTIDIIGVGSLIPLKQYAVFIEVIERLKMSYPSINTVIIGDGPERDPLQKLITEKGLENNIELKGELPHTDTINYMKQSKLLLHPSSYEGYGMVCLEALAAGCHVTSFVSPEDQKIEHWNIVSGTTEMETAARKILSLPGDEFYPVIHRKIDDTANEILSLFREQRS